MAWSTWRMYRRVVVGVSPHHHGRNHDPRVFDKEYSPTGVTFRARTYEEAMRKGDRLWRDAEIGVGSFIMKEEEE